MEPESAGGLCEIDPSACPKQGDVETLAARQLVRDLWDIGGARLEPRRGRTELRYQTFGSPTAEAIGPRMAIDRWSSDRLGFGADASFGWWGAGPPSAGGLATASAFAHALWVPWSTERWDAKEQELTAWDLLLQVGAGAAARPEAERFPIRPAVEGTVGVRTFLTRSVALFVDARAATSLSAPELELSGAVGFAVFVPRVVTFRSW